MRDPRVGYGFAKSWDSETDYCAKVAMARQDEIDRLRVELSALQAENAELQEENGCMRHNVSAMQATLDQQAKNCEALLEEKSKEIERLTERLQVSPYGDDKIDELEESCENLRFRAETAEQKLSRVEAERDVLLEYANANMECEMCKNDTFCLVTNPMPEDCALCELKPKCPCHPCKWEWRGAQREEWQ